MKTKREILSRRIGSDDPAEEARLLRAADRCRKRRVGDEIHLRGIIEFSSYCRQNCLYCGLRSDNRGLERYRLGENEIFSLARRCEELKIPTVVLQSGEDPEFPPERVCRLVEKIKKKTGLAVTVCVGEMSREECRRLKAAGADRYLLKIETSNRALFEKLKPGCSFEKRRECLETLRETGFQVGSGNMVGLPGQDEGMLADDILFFRRMRMDMIGIGPFLPHPDTPLAGHPAPRLEKVLRVLALARLLNPEAHLPATTSVGTLHREGRQRALACGANVLMPNLTPAARRPYYQIYPGKICLNEEAGQCRACVSRMAAEAGRTIASGPGHGQAWSRRRKRPGETPGTGTRARDYKR